MAASICAKNLLLNVAPENFSIASGDSPLNCFTPNQYQQCTVNSGDFIWSRYAINGGIEQPDFVAIVGDDLTGDLDVSFYPTSGSTPAASVQTFTFQSGKRVHLFPLTSPAAGARVRLDFSGTSTANVHYIALGNLIDLPTLESGFRSPTEIDSYDIVNNVSIGGLFLDRVTRRTPLAFDIDQRNVSRAWLDANYDELAKELNQTPLFLFYRNGEAALCWTREALQPSSSLRARRHSIRIRAEGIR